jgi:hypothetical protein
MENSPLAKAVIHVATCVECQVALAAGTRGRRKGRKEN